MHRVEPGNLARQAGYIGHPRQLVVQNRVSAQVSDRGDSRRRQIARGAGRQQEQEDHAHQSAYDAERDQDGPGGEQFIPAEQFGQRATELAPRHISHGTPQRVAEIPERITRRQRWVVALVHHMLGVIE